MIHTISGNNFHGNYSVNLRGPKDGFILSASQVRRYMYVAVPCSGGDCVCGGGYGEGLDDGSARIAQRGYNELELIPADIR